MITLTLPTDDAELIADVLRQYALEDFADAQTEAENGNRDLLEACAYLDFSPVSSPPPRSAPSSIMEHVTNRVHERAHSELKGKGWRVGTCTSAGK